MENRILVVAKAWRRELAWWVQKDHTCGLDMSSRECGNRSLKAAGLDHIGPCRDLDFIIRTGPSFILPPHVCVFHSVQQIVTEHLLCTERNKRVSIILTELLVGWVGEETQAPKHLKSKVKSKMIQGVDNQGSRD